MWIACERHHERLTFKKAFTLPVPIQPKSHMRTWGQEHKVWPHTLSRYCVGYWFFTLSQWQLVKNAPLSNCFFSSAVAIFSHALIFKN